MEVTARWVVHFPEDSGLGVDRRAYRCDLAARLVPGKVVSVVRARTASPCSAVDHLEVSDSRLVAWPPSQDDTVLEGHQDLQDPASAAEVHPR